MPRATKETKKDELKEEKKATKSKSSVKKTTTKKTSTTKKAASETKKKSTAKKSSSAAKKTSSEKKATSTSVTKNKKTTSKKEEPTKTKAATKKVAEKKETKPKKVASTTKKETKASKSTSSKKSTKKATKKESATTKKTATTKKAASKSTKKRTTSTKSKKLESNIVAEYYDLPYRYNETIVKILYQTPSVLFVYWDISDDDRNKFIHEYGENFFYQTKPILKIFNITKNYNFEIDINDFANSWYINVNDANCEYKVELGRRPISYDSNINTDYIYVSSSNDIEFPNDHILIDELPEYINFKNVKTGKISTRNISTLRFVGINNIYSIYDFYKVLYNENILDEINNKNFLSSSSPSSWSN